MKFKTFQEYILQIYGEEKDYLTKFALTQLLKEIKPIFTKLSLSQQAQSV